VNEHGEFKQSSISDSKETYRLATFGEIIAVSRQVIVNDDLSALTRVPAGLGRSAANLESDTVWGIVTANAALSDGVALFHATHANLGNIALGDDGLANIRKLMRLQTAPKGSLLNVVPKFVMVPAALEQTLLRLVSPIGLRPNDADNVVPEWVMNLTPVVEPRLDAASATDWYASADPEAIDTIEYCYLEGEEGVYIESRPGFNVDGIELKARLDFAAAAIDHRGLAKSIA
jgi:hypothetical protein